jgi:membrane fusion protein (multidrug efflux system)
MNSGRIAETDNAYVKADTVVLSAEVPGRIVAVHVAENEPVTAGQVLVEIDDSPYQVARRRAESQLEAVTSFVVGMQASYQQALDELALARSEVAFNEREVVREESLAERSLGSERDLDVARYDLEQARLNIPILEQRLAQLEAQLGGEIHGGYQAHPAYRTVKAMLDDASLDLEHTTIRAPIDGVASHVPLAGGYVARGAPVMSLVSPGNVWIEANFKETQLTYVRPGQPVTVHLDTYPGREWHGSVASISQATGAEFSVIPAQNASGNWVKVTQRITVRIALDRQTTGDAQLRAGMSAIAEVDTGHRRELPAPLGFLRILVRDD